MFPFCSFGASESIGSWRLGSVELDKDALRVEVRIELFGAAFAPISAHLIAAERHRGIYRMIRVYPDRSGAKAAREDMRLAHVAGENTCRQPVLGRIGSLDGLIERVE